MNEGLVYNIVEHNRNERTVLARKVITSGQNIFKVELSKCISAKVDRTRNLFTSPLVQEVYNRMMAGVFNWQYYPTYEYYKSKSPMYMTFNQIKTLCDKHYMNYKLVVNNCLINLYELYGLYIANQLKSLDTLLHAYHIVGTRCFMDKRTETIYLVNQADMLNHSTELANTTYYFSTRGGKDYFILKAERKINKGEELYDRYTDKKTETKEKLFLNYNYICEEAVSDKTIPEMFVNVEELEKNKDFLDETLYDFTIKLVDEMIKKTLQRDDVPCQRHQRHQRDDEEKVQSV